MVVPISMISASGMHCLCGLHFSSMHGAGRAVMLTQSPLQPRWSSFRFSFQRAYTTQLLWPPLPRWRLPQQLLPGARLRACSWAGRQALRPSHPRPRLAWRSRQLPCQLLPDLRHLLAAEVAPAPRRPAPLRLRPQDPQPAGSLPPHLFQQVG